MSERMNRNRTLHTNTNQTEDAMRSARVDAWKVGELARRTGLSVRTLHHYDEMGLVKPSRRTHSGHRLYEAEDIARLQQALSLRQLGFSLEEIRDCLSQANFSPLRTIRLHLDRLRQQMALQNQLRERLEELERVCSLSDVTSADQLIQVIEAMSMIENYYTPEQLDALKKRGEAIGPEAIRAVEQEWPKLMDAVKVEMEAGTDPADPKVQALAKRWSELVESFTGGDPGITASLNRLWKEQGNNLAAQHNMNYDPKMFEYIGKAIAIVKGSDAGAGPGQ